MKTPLNILIVEDEPMLQDVYNLVLTNQGHSVHIAGNGEEGLNLVKKVNPDIILLDVFMPILDGKEFLRNFDKSKYPKTRVIVCSNLSGSTVQHEVMELGADEYVLKASLGPAELIALVKDNAKSDT